MIATKLCDLENHRDAASYESSLTQMTYRFNFFNVYISYFILAFWETNISTLASSVFTFMVYKQIGMNLLEWAQYSLYINYKIKK